MELDRQTYTEYVCKTIREAAEKIKREAALFGERGDGGAHVILDRLDYWTDGIRFCCTGESEVYGHLIKEYDNARDPEYQKYLELKQKFEK